MKLWYYKRITLITYFDKKSIIAFLHNIVIRVVYYYGLVITIDTAKYAIVTD